MFKQKTETTEPLQTENMADLENHRCNMVPVQDFINGKTFKRMGTCELRQQSLEMQTSIFKPKRDEEIDFPHDDRDIEFKMID